MSEPRMVPTIAKPAAPLIAWGLLCSLLGVPLLLAAGYAGWIEVLTDDDGASVPLSVAGWGLLGLGAVLLVVGVFRLVQHADRAAGIRYPAAVQPAPGTEVPAAPAGE